MNINLQQEHTSEPEHDMNDNKMIINGIPIPSIPLHMTKVNGLTIPVEHIEIIRKFRDNESGDATSMMRMLRITTEMRRENRGVRNFSGKWSKLVESV